MFRVGDVWDDCEDISLRNKHVVGGGGRENKVFKRHLGPQRSHHTSVKSVFDFTTE